MTDGRAELEAYLHEMGLSEYETRAYLTLLERGILTAGAASESTDIPQSRIYDVCASLERKGFVKVQPGRPKKYGAIDPKTAVERYCEFRRDEFQTKLSKTRTAGDALVESFEAEPLTTGDHDDTDVFWSYRGKDRLLDHVGDLCAEAEAEILVMTAAYSFERVVAYYKELLAERAAEGVDIRLLVAGADDVNPEVWETAQTWSTLRVASGIAGRVYLIDGSTVILAFRNDTDTQYAGVVINSTDLYETLAELFAIKWDRHADEPPANEA